MTASELRAHAARLRESGQRAECTEDMRRDYAEARRLEAEADKLDGLFDPAPRPSASTESTGDYNARQRQRIANAMEQMEALIRK